MFKTIATTACVLGLLAVVLGAFGAHGLQNLVSDKAIASFETGVRYQMYHVFFLFALALMPKISDVVKQRIFYSTLVGIFLFSFSIYVLSLNALFTFDFKSIAVLTPIGGLFLIMAWGLFGFAVYKSR